MVRARNEDSFFRDDSLQLYIVADGMGGHKGGDIASRMSVEEIVRIVKEWRPEDADDITGIDGTRPEIEMKLLLALKRANVKIWQAAEVNPEHRGMGTTSTAAMVKNGEITFAHVGDSRAYIIRDNEIRQITEDHSWVNEQVKAGFISSEEARTHRFKNLITRSLGNEPSVKIDVLRLSLKIGDGYFMCSDGLSNMIMDEEIRDVLIQENPQDALKQLVAVANKRGGHDNITAVYIGVMPD